VLSFIDGSLLRFWPFNAIAWMKRINRPGVIFTNRHVVLLSLYRRLGLRLHAGWSEEKGTRMLRGSLFNYESDEECEGWSRPVDLVH
jgi:hypothetical protein